MTTENKIGVALIFIGAGGLLLMIVGFTALYRQRRHWRKR